MRKIKFRIWHKLEKRWLDPWAEEDPTLSLKDFGKGCEVFLWDRESQGWSNLNCQMDNIVIQQYVGIVDKNGVEIYDGDIVKTPHDGIGLVEFNDKNYGSVLGWNLMEYPPPERINVCSGALDYYYGLSPRPTHEVIGNIFEGIK